MLRLSLAAIVLLVAMVVAIGYALPLKHQATREATFKATPDAIFRLITTVDAYPTWRSGLKTVEILPPTDGRTRFREVSGQGTIAFVVESMEPNKRVVTRIDDTSLPFGGTWTYELTLASDGRTTLRIIEDGEIYNPVFRFVSRFIMGYDGTIKTYLADVGRKVGA